MVSFFIHRPIFASSIAVIMVLAGAICYFLLPVSQFSRHHASPGSSSAPPYSGRECAGPSPTPSRPPLEQQINGVQGMTYMSSREFPMDRLIHYHGDLRRRLSAEHRGGGCAEPRCAGRGLAAADRQSRAASSSRSRIRTSFLIVNLVSPDRSVDPVGAQQLRLSSGGRSPKARAGRRRRADIRRAALFDADMAGSGTGLPNWGITAVDVQQGRRRAERPGRRRQDRAIPSPPKAPHSRMQVNATGRLSDPRAVRRHSGARGSRERGRSSG